MDKRQRRRAYFHEQLANARDMAKVLRYSRQQVASLLEGDSSQWDETQAVQWEALSARFARLADSLLQKLFRAVDALELVDEGSLIDRLTRMEKRGVIESLDRWLEIRELRNPIAHDYVAENLVALQLEVFHQCPLLFDALTALEHYAERQGWEPT